MSAEVSLLFHQILAIYYHKNYTLSSILVMTNHIYK
jgi:hypothetical protein